ncbi:lectin beta-1 and beta-2 chains-like [Lolium perenne]|uniref:lectin beta-1 and beta-2 chains-like n=1 Tax=Lolium perenne TaxID=4522 RepID=UPI0021F66DC2|nr:lectin beta-1 and beta-2 chains-like [Lolium perenne]
MRPTGKARADAAWLGLRSSEQQTPPTSPKAHANATACIILAACFFFLPSFLANHVAAASPPLSFSFDFTNTSKYRLQDLRFEGDAALNGKLVDLTRNPTADYCSGRMSFNHPVQFYDNTTGEVASFSTTFTFAMNMPNTTIKGDRMSFFISGYPSRLPPESYGSVLGLTNSSTNISSGADRFLAVEFDTYANAWDPTGSPDHMGIDLFHHFGEHNEVAEV